MSKVEELSKEEKVEAKKLAEYFDKPETQKIVGELVVQFQTVFGFQWFTMDDVIKIFKDASVEQLVDIIQTLDLCGFLIVNSKKEGIMERYRLSANAVQNSVDDTGKK